MQNSLWEHVTADGLDEIGIVVNLDGELDLFMGSTDPHGGCNGSLLLDFLVNQELWGTAREVFGQPILEEALAEGRRLLAATCPAPWARPSGAT